MEADILVSKEIFAERGARAGAARPGHRAGAGDDEGRHAQRAVLPRPPGPRASTRTRRRAQLETAIDWGRYGELFDFDAVSGELRLDQRGREVAAAEAAHAAA